MPRLELLHFAVDFRVHFFGWKFSFPFSEMPLFKIQYKNTLESLACTVEEIASYVDIQYRSNTFNRMLSIELERFQSNAFNQTLTIERFQSNAFNRTLSIKCFQSNAFHRTLSIERFQSNAFNRTLSIEHFRYLLDVRTTGNFFHCGMQ